MSPFTALPWRLEMWLTAHIWALSHSGLPVPTECGICANPWISNSRNSLWVFNPNSNRSPFFLLEEIRMQGGMTIDKTEIWSKGVKPKIWCIILSKKIHYYSRRLIVLQNAGLHVLSFLSNHVVVWQWKYHVLELSSKFC